MTMGGSTWINGHMKETKAIKEVKSPSVKNT